MTNISNINQNLQPGMTVRVHQQIKETNTKGEEKQRIQIYQGIILNKSNGNGVSSSITVRKISGSVGVEKIFPLNSPNVVKVETIKQAKVRRAKLNYLRKSKKRLKETKL